MRIIQPTPMPQLKRLVAAFRRRLKIQKAIAELKELEDFMLLDIGLWRSDIERFVSKGRCDDINRLE
ncbi:DUF1127 domain-containing protein [Rhizobium laguerreae]|uniref:DUF1127 domain-containing protein n=1 Tax=Rhizobium laguerreae TaxID=1076926 RepID=UPI0028A96513|nr:DUF1127 domain-containing protein [Rhizobium laguerreae]